MRDTISYKNSYKKFGDTLYVDHWFKNVDQIYPSILRNTDEIKGLIHLNKLWKRPDWYIPAMKLENRQYKRLDLSGKLDRRGYDNFLFTKNGRFISKHTPATIKDCEYIARKYPKNDYRIELLYSFEYLTYQRQGRNKWILIEDGKGWA